MGSYRIRLSLLFVGTLLVLFGVASYVFVRYDRSLVREELRSRTRAIANTLIETTKSGVSADPVPVEVLQPLCEGLAHLGDVKWAEVFDEEGTVVAHSISERLGEPPLPLHHEYVLRLLNGAPAIDEWDDERKLYILFVPIHSETGSVTAVVELVMDTAWIEGAATAGWVRLGLLFLGLMLGGFVALFLGTRKIVDSESARRAAEASASHLGDIIERSLNEIYVFDAETLLFDAVNRGARRNLGYTSEEIHHLTPLDIKPEYTREAFEARIAPLRSGDVERIHFETVHRRKDGSTYPVEVFLGASERGATPVLVAVVLDVTERERAEQELRQSHKMQAVGQLAAGIAHDFNNLLTVIGGSIDLVQHHLSDPTVSSAPIRGRLNDAKGAVESAASITRQLLTFSQADSISPVPLDIGNVLEALLPMLRRMIREDIELEFRAERDLATANMDVGQLEQLVMNLTINARDAMPEGGTLRFHVANDPPSGVARWVCLTVTDSGNGIAQKDLGRIFDPFFTTKPLGEGTGLGLATVHGIVEQSGGNVRVESEVGKGTRFEVRLPASDQKTTMTHKDDVGAAPDGGTETIVVSEDNDSVRAVLQLALEQAGYDVVATEDAARALETAADESLDVRLLITDVVMPGMNGRDLADRFLEQRPDTQVLFVTGYAPADLETDGRTWSSENLLRKPFRIPDLLRRVRALLDAATQIG